MRLEGRCGDWELANDSARLNLQRALTRAKRIILRPSVREEKSLVADSNLAVKELLAAGIISSSLDVPRYLLLVTIPAITVS